MKKNLKTILLILIILIIILSLGYYFFIIKNQENFRIGGDADKNGCLMSAGFSWCEAKNKCLRTWEEYCGEKKQELSFNLLNNLKQKSGTNFSSITDTVLIWTVAENKNIKEKTINGLQIKADDSGKTDGLKKYFQQQGFSLNKYNVAEGMIAGATGFQKDNLVCLITESFKNFALIEEQNIPETEARYGDPCVR